MSKKLYIGNIWRNTSKINDKEYYTFTLKRKVLSDLLERDPNEKGYYVCYLDEAKINDKYLYSVVYIDTKEDEL